MNLSTETAESNFVKFVDILLRGMTPFSASFTSPDKKNKNKIAGVSCVAWFRMTFRIIQNKDNNPIGKFLDTKVGK